VIKSRRIKWMEDVEGMGRSAYMLLMGKPEGRGHFKDPGLNGRSILK